MRFKPEQIHCHVQPLYHSVTSYFCENYKANTEKERIPFILDDGTILCPKTWCGASRELRKAASPKIFICFVKSKREAMTLMSAAKRHIGSKWQQLSHPNYNYHGIIGWLTRINLNYLSEVKDICQNLAKQSDQLEKRPIERPTDRGWLAYAVKFVIFAGGRVRLQSNLRRVSLIKNVKTQIKKEELMLS